METRDGWAFCMPCARLHNYCEHCGSINYNPNHSPDNDFVDYQQHYSDACHRWED